MPEKKCTEGTCGLPPPVKLESRHNYNLYSWCDVKPDPTPPKKVKFVNYIDIQRSHQLDTFKMHPIRKSHTVITWNNTTLKTLLTTVSGCVTLQVWQIICHRNHVISKISVMSDFSLQLGNAILRIYHTRPRALSLGLGKLQYHTILGLGLGKYNTVPSLG